MNCDIYKNYREVNTELDLREEEALSNDKNVEDPMMIVGVWKWTYEGFSEEGPDFSFIGLTMKEHIPLRQKYDLFIYVSLYI